MAGQKPLLLLTIFWLFVAWLFVIIATAIVDWSKSTVAAYGIWKVCQATNSDLCSQWYKTEEPFFKDCEGSLVATQAFSVISIIWLFFPLVLAILFLIKPTKMNKKLLLVLICLIALGVLWTFLGWVMYLGVEARGQCWYHDYDTHLGSSWFLQLFAWFFTMIATVTALLLFMKWKKTPKYYNTPPVGAAMYGKPGYPGYPEPYPYGPKDPYHPYGGPVPYYPYAAYPPAPVYGPPPAAHPDGLHTTPTGSPYVPSPFY